MTCVVALLAVRLPASRVIRARVQTARGARRLLEPLAVRASGARCAVRACAPPSARVDEWMLVTGRTETPAALSSATTLAAALSDFWAQVCTTADSPFAERALVFPLLEADARAFARLMAHINSCSEVCETLGSSVFVAPRHPGGTNGNEPPAPYPMLLLKTLKGSGDEPSDEDDEDDMPGYYDELWPDDKESIAERAICNPPAQEAVVLQITRKWVEAVICHMGVCPFSHSADRAGLPQGGVSYPITRAKTADEVYLEFWHQVTLLDTTDERQLSTVLLITPDFMLRSAAGFDQFADTLTEALCLLGVEARQQLVFFHPEFTFRDGKDRAGADGTANYARRSPWPMINLLRTPQVRAAQKGLPTGSVYEVNERNMASVGLDTLDWMLRAQDWSRLYRRADFIEHARPPN
ncbi:hypothetical protein KFE25_002806 [Diacronema lutheri]|uniref:Uncharacterized protein n=2 Tax=Diacronema lutheri TaxID=2081491 RepID=A0A8J5XRZ2_DIALT|nr:hypothetical protein KFE25_002806 [Diacronema lutheri]